MDADWLLILRMRQGSDEAWELFIRKYYQDILKYCFFHCMDRQNAEDLTQEVFLRFFSALGEYQHRGKAKNYLYTIAGNLCKDQAAQTAPLPLEDFQNLLAESDDLDDQLVLDAAVRRLPKEFQDIIVLHYYQGLKLPEVAVLQGIGLPLTKYRLKRAKDLLRKEIKYGFD